MNIIKYVAVATALTYSLTACKNDAQLNDAAQSIPAKASQVTLINIPSMMKKMDFEAVKQMDFYKAAIADANNENPALAEILKNPAKSGVDLSKNIYFAAERGMRIYLTLSDASAFEAMLNAAKAGAATEKNGVKIIGSSGTEFVAWKGNLAILGMGGANNARMPFDFANLSNGFKKDTVDIVALFNVKKDESISQNEQFKKVAAGNHDFASWASLAELANLAGAGLPFDVKELKESYVTGTADFENGKVVSKSEYKLAPSLVKNFGIAFKDNVKTDFSKYLNQPNIAFAATFALDAKGIQQILKENMELSAFMQQVNNKGFTTEDILRALDGDMMFAFGTQNGEMTPSLAFKVGDKNTLQKFLNMAVQNNLLKEQGNGAYLIPNEIGSSAKLSGNSKIFLKDDMLFLGMSETPNAGTNEKLKVLSNNIFGMYVNFNEFFKSVPMDKAGDIANNNPFNEMQMTLGSKSGETVITTKNPNENTLKSLVQFINQMYLTAQKGKMQVQ